jgi:hypothetical protein
MNGPQLVESSGYVDDVGPRRIVLTVPTYEDAAAAVAYLEDAYFPVDRVTIAARDITLVENVVARRTAFGTAVSGLGAGLVIGAAVGLLSAALGTTEDGTVLGPVGVGTAIGAFLGFALALVFHALSSRRGRGVVSESGVHADRYDLLVDEQLAGESTNLLNQWALADPRRRLRSA